MIVSPKLNRTRPQTSITNNPTFKPIAGVSITRRHTIALGSHTVSTQSARFLRNLKQIDIESTSDEIIKLVRRQQYLKKKVKSSKSASNLADETVEPVGERISRVVMKSQVSSEENSKTMKKTILDLSPLSISASSVSSSSANSNDANLSKSNSSRSSLMSENREKKAKLIEKVLVTNLADEVGSVSQMSTSATNNVDSELKNNVKKNLNLNSKTKYESLI